MALHVLPHTSGWAILNDEDRTEGRQFPDPVLTEKYKKGCMKEARKLQKKWGEELLEHDKTGRIIKRYEREHFTDGYESIFKSEKVETTNCTEYCTRCEKVLDEWGGTTIGPFEFEMTPEKH